MFLQINHRQFKLGAQIVIGATKVYTVKLPALAAAWFGLTTSALVILRRHGAETKRSVQKSKQFRNGMKPIL